MVYNNFLEQCFLDPFLTQLWSKKGPFSKHFEIFRAPKRVTWAENGLKILVSASQMVEINFWKNTFLTHFSSSWGPRMDFRWAKTRHKQAPHGLKTLS